MREAGFGLRVALDVFIHHFGSRTFAGLGIDCRRQLEENFARFQAKWGPERSAGYRLAPPGPSAPDGPREDREPSLELRSRATKKSRPARVSPAIRPDIAPPVEKGLRVARPRVSLCVIVKNEEANLPECLGSAADLVDEMIVLDTGSTDGTREVAARSAACVFEFAWVDDFAAARNESLRHATGEWIFWLDADDRAGPGRAAQAAPAAGLKDENVAYVMKCRAVGPGWRATGADTIVDHIRPFRNDPQSLAVPVHEQVMPSVRPSGSADPVG